MPEPITPNKAEVARSDEAWHRFLAMLAPDRAGANALYHELRRRLIDLFRWRGLGSADDLADEALERAVRHVADGNEIRSVTGYVCGIANRLALEAARREAREVPLAEGSGEESFARPGGDDDTGRRLDSLERCLERLPGETRRLVLRYYAVGPGRPGDRRALAEELGIGLNALRIRIHRVRAALETCVAGSEAS